MSDPTYDGRYNDFEQSIIRGDDYEFPFVVRLPNVGASPPYTDSNTTRVDLTDWDELWCTGKRGSSLNEAADADALFQVTLSGGGIVLTDAAEGEGKVVLTPDETGELPVEKDRPLFVDVQGKDASGKIHTLCTGRFPVRADTTRATAVV